MSSKLLSESSFNNDEQISVTEIIFKSLANCNFLDPFFSLLFLAYFLQIYYAIKNRKSSQFLLPNLIINIIITFTSNYIGEILQTASFLFSSINPFQISKIYCIIFITIPFMLINMMLGLFLGYQLIISFFMNSGSNRTKGKPKEKGKKGALKTE